MSLLQIASTRALIRLAMHPDLQHDRYGVTPDIVHQLLSMGWTPIHDADTSLLAVGNSICPCLVFETWHDCLTYLKSMGMYSGTENAV